MMSRSMALAVILGSGSLGLAQSPALAPTAPTVPLFPTVSERVPVAASPSVDDNFGGSDDSGSAVPRVTASAEYLMWWIKSDRPAMPLLTTGGAGGGALGASDTAVLFRLSDLPKDVPYNGGRFALGLWATQDAKVGLDIAFFFLQQRDFTFGAGSNATGSPLLSVPYFDQNPAINGPSFSQISVPGVLVGHVEAVSTIRLWGMEADFKANLFRSEGLSVNALLGYRQADLRETFGFTQDVTRTVGIPLLSLDGNSIPAGDSLQIADRFGTHNAFYGCDIGLRTTWSPFSKVAVDLTTKIALGAVSQKLDVSGSTTQLSPGGAPVASVPGGLFALPALNLGTISHSDCAVLPEVAIRLRYSVTDWMDVSVGYDFLYWNNVIRPGDQVPSTINSSFSPSQVPFANGGPLAPLPTFHRTDFSVQGFNFGLELRF
jgi:Putative beta barrel porin-7 (BBP7)